MVELALDCAANACSVAVARGGKLLASHWRRMERGHAEAAPVMLERAMADAGAAFPEISRIIVTRGPGAWIAAVPTFEALRPAEPPEGRLFAVLDTKRGSLYAADLSGAVEPFVTTAEALLAKAPFAVTGDAAADLAALAPRSIRALAPALPDAARLFGRTLPAGPVSPLYLTPPHTGPVTR